MFLPEKAAFLGEAFDFLQQYNWIFRSSNTEYIANGTLDEIPSDWVDCLLNVSIEELNQIPFGLIKVRVFFLHTISNNF